MSDDGATAAGMEAATHDRLAWTDDDFDHPDDWLATLQADYERHGPVGTAVMNAVTLAVALACLLYPLYLIPALTLVHAATYAAFGVRRWTFVLAAPATVAWVPLFAYGVARRTFVWGGRRYRWRSTFDVEVVER